MSALLDVLEKAAGRAGYYPRWAQALFATTFASVLVSVFLFAFGAPAAREHKFLEEIGFDVSVGAGSHPTYVQERRGRTVAIAPDLPYLDLLDRGGPIEISGAHAPDWSDTNYLPVLNVNLTNNGSSTIFITQGWLDVERSVPQRRPILVVWPIDAARTIELENDGWSDLESVILAFNVVRAGSTPVFRPPYRHHIAVGRVHDHRTVDITRAVAQEGVDLSTIYRLERKVAGSRFVSLSPVEERALRLALKPFGNEYALTVGEIRYRDRGLQRRVRFSSPLVLFERPPPSPPPPPVIDFVAQARLQPEGIDYARAVQFAGEGEVLKAGDVGRFAISADAAFSSRHRFRVRLQTNDGHELVSPPVDLSIFVPRYHRAPGLEPP
jgi:hypothetical protein